METILFAILFENVGRKIQITAIVSFIIEAIGAIIFGIMLFANDSALGFIPLINP